MSSLSPSPTGAATGQPHPATYTAPLHAAGARNLSPRANDAPARSLDQLKEYGGMGPAAACAVPGATATEIPTTDEADGRSRDPPSGPTSTVPASATPGSAPASFLTPLACSSW